MGLMGVMGLMIETLFSILLNFFRLSSILLRLSSIFLKHF